MKDILTIVIPCKNEGWLIYDSLALINNQKYIYGTKVIIADSSDEFGSLNIINSLKSCFSNIDIEIIDGGLPAKARLEGSKLVKTPYLLFLDADMFIRDRELIYKIYRSTNVYLYSMDLLTVTYKTDFKWDWCYRIFDIVQWLSRKLNCCFAIGGFQFWRTQAYWNCGGYNPDEMFAEDFSLSQKVSPKNFLVYRTNKVYTPSRRLEKKGIWYMMRLMFKSYKNRNNPEFFKQHHDYWI